VSGDELALHYGLAAYPLRVRKIDDLVSTIVSIAVRSNPRPSGVPQMT
jgi:hypothetical protein